MDTTRSTSSIPAPTWKGSRAHWLAAATGTAISAAAILVMAVMSVVSAVTGSASTTTRALTEAAMLVVLGGAVLALVVGLVRAKSLAKTPTLLWNAMLVPIGFSLMDGGAAALGIATVIVAVVTFVVALPLPRYDVDVEDGAAL